MITHKLVWLTYITLVFFSILFAWLGWTGKSFERLAQEHVAMFFFAALISINAYIWKD